MQGTRPKEQQGLPAESRCGVKTGAVCCLNTSLVSTFPEYSREWRQSTLRRIPLKYNVGWYRVEQTPLSAAESADRGVFWAGASSLYNPLSIMIGWYRAESAPVPELDPGKGAFSV